MIMMALLSNKNLFAKNTMDSIKLSICLFRGGMRDSGSEMYEIGKLDGTYVITRSTFLLEET
jgi:hypothetical protein